MTKLLTPERRAELERKGELEHDEAAEYLEVSPRRLYNMVSAAKEPGCSQLAPKQARGGKGVRAKYLISELKAFKKVRGY